MSALWPNHPIFGAKDEADAAQRLDQFGDGLIALDPDGVVLSANSEALSVLGRGAAEVIGRRLDGIEPATDGWGDLLECVAEARRADVPLRGPGGRPIIASLRRTPQSGAIQWIMLRDVEAFEFRRDKCFGPSRPRNVTFLASARTRPDFDTQRRLCPEIHRLLSRGERAIRMGARILITGESGVGKSEIARFLHGTVSDARDPFVVVDCAAASAARFEDALFGRDGQGGQHSPGLIEQAQGGTLFLDEVGDMPLSAQARLLGVLEDERLSGLGGQPNVIRNLRVIAATNRDLRQLVREGRFRADLYFRIAVVPLRVPPLRELPPLVDHLIDRFLQTINRRRQVPVIVPQRLREILADYSFPGNIRELLNIVQRVAVLVEDTEDVSELLDDLIAPMDVPGAETRPDLDAGAALDLRAEVRRFERALIDKAIRIHGSKRKAAKALGVDIGTIVRKTVDTVDGDADAKKLQQGE